MSYTSPTCIMAIPEFPIHDIMQSICTSTNISKIADLVGINFSDLGLLILERGRNEGGRGGEKGKEGGERDKESENRTKEEKSTHTLSPSSLTLPHPLLLLTVFVHIHEPYTNAILM